jgi:hypothetical protein
MKMRVGTVLQAINKYWRDGFNNSLIILDVAVLLLCVVDLLRFAGSGGSPVSLLQVTAEAVINGVSLGLAIAVLMFFIVALPMFMALLSGFLTSRGHWPPYFARRSKRVIELHVLLSAAFAFFTVTTIAMEVLSGFAKDEYGLKYRFVSIWLGTVLFCQPLYVAYVSPIIRKFVVRFTADPTNAAHKLKDVASEVGTEEGLGR